MITHVFQLVSSREVSYPCKGMTAFSADYFAREQIRLDLTLSAAQKLMDENSTLVMMLHYPPVINKTKFNQFCPVMERYNVKYCVYGHLHGVNHSEAEIVENNGIKYILSSCDMIDFSLREIK